MFQTVRSEVFLRGKALQAALEQVRSNPSAPLPIISARVDSSVVGAAIQRAGQLHAKPDMVLAFFHEALQWARTGLLQLDRPVILFGIVIDFLANRDARAEALRVYSDMLALGVQPNSIVVTSTIKACRLAMDFKAALRVFNHARTVCQVPPTVPMFTELLKAAPFTSTTSSSTLDIETSHSDLAAAPPSRVALAVSLLDVARPAGEGPVPSSSCRLESSCPVERLHAILNEVLEADKKGLLNAPTLSDAPLSSSSSSSATIDRVFFLVALGLFAKLGASQGTQRVLTEMRQRGMLVVDSDKDASLIGGLNGEEDQTQAVGASLNQTLPCVLNAFAKCGKLQATFRAFDDAVSAANAACGTSNPNGVSSVERNVAAWTCMLSACATAIEQRMDFEATCDAAHFSRAKSIERACHTSALLVDARGGPATSPEEARERSRQMADAAEEAADVSFFSQSVSRLLACMRERSVQMDAPVFQVAVRAFAQAGDWPKALSVYHEALRATTSSSPSSTVFSHWNQTAFPQPRPVVDLFRFTTQLARTALRYAVLFEQSKVLSAARGAAHEDTAPLSLLIKVAAPAPAHIQNSPSAVAAATESLIQSPLVAAIMQELSYLSVVLTPSTTLLGSHGLLSVSLSSLECFYRSPSSILLDKLGMLPAASSSVSPLVAAFAEAAPMTASFTFPLQQRDMFEDEMDSSQDNVFAYAKPTNSNDMMMNALAEQPNQVEFVVKEKSQTSTAASTCSSRSPLSVCASVTVDAASPLAVLPMTPSAFCTPSFFCLSPSIIEDVAFVADSFAELPWAALGLRFAPDFAAGASLEVFLQMCSEKENDVHPSTYTSYDDMDIPPGFEAYVQFPAPQITTTIQQDNFCMAAPQLVAQVACVQLCSDCGVLLAVTKEGQCEGHLTLADNVLRSDSTVTRGPNNQNHLGGFIQQESFTDVSCSASAFEDSQCESYASDETIHIAPRSPAASPKAAPFTWASRLAASPTTAPTTCLKPVAPLVLLPPPMTTLVRGDSDLEGMLADVKRVALCEAINVEPILPPGLLDW